MSMFNLEPAAFLLSVFCLVYSLTVNRTQYSLPDGFKNTFLSQHFMFLVLIISNMLSAASSVLGVYINPYASESLVLWQYLLHAVYFVFHSTLAMSFALYIMNVNGASIGRSRKFFIAFILPYVLGELLVLTNVFTDFAFYMDENYVYHRGPLMPILYIIGLGYFVVGFVFFFRYKKAMAVRDARAIGVMMTMSACGVLVQAAHPELMVELFCEALTFLGLMLMLEERRGHTDPITGALNRIALVDANRRLISTGQGYRIILVKLSDMHVFLRMYNGMEMGDLLMQISAWLTSLSSEQNLYNFRDGDFAILYSEISDFDIYRIADKILKRFNEEWTTEDEAYKLEATVSIIRVPEDVSTLDDLMGILTSGYSKTGVGSRMVSFDEISVFQHDQQVEKSLREAMKNKQLEVYYQPIWSEEEEKVVGAEAVLHVNNDILQGLSPEMYLPIAEQSGLIWDIGMFVFEEVCRFIRGDKAQQYGISFIEINFSEQQFTSESLVSSLEKIRTKYDVPGNVLNLEIMKSATVRDPSMIPHTMDALKALGYSFSFGDFGSGAFDLSGLIRNGYKNVRINRSLLWDAEFDEKISMTLGQMVHMLRGMGFNVIQDGVETEYQYRLNRETGANLIQGHLVGDMLSEEEFVDIIRTKKKLHS